MSKSKYDTKPFHLRYGKSTGKAERDALQEGIRARRDGKPCQSPYAGIELLRAADAAWVKGWEAGQ
jgi:hypothetical protein